MRSIPDAGGAGCHLVAECESADPVMSTPREVGNGSRLGVETETATSDEMQRRVLERSCGGCCCCCCL